MRWIACILPLAVCATTMAQFGVPGATRVRERITGKLLSAEGAPTPAQGDQLGVFFNNTLCGAVTFDTTNDFSILIYGDLASTTTVVEGPKPGEAVAFRFYDASANATRTDLRVETLTGEAYNYRYAGEEQTIPDGLPIPIDLTPTRSLNIKIGATSGGGGGGTDDPTAKYDVDGNGKVDTADAAMILRIVTGGASRGVSDEIKTRADVNADKKVDTADAIEVMQNR